jgi:hypothetical protein
MLKIDTAHFLTIGLTAAVLGCACAPSEAAVRLAGQVQAGGGPVANSNVTLWAAGSGEPRQIGQTTTSSDGRFTLGSDETVGADIVLYLVAKGGEAAVNKGSGDNPAVALLAVLGNTPPPVSDDSSSRMRRDGGDARAPSLGYRICRKNFFCSRQELSDAVPCW